MSMTSNDITQVLYRHFMNRVRCDAAIHNNTNMLSYCGESDFLAVTKAGLIHEVEVKVSRGDFFADFKNKPERHLHLSGKGVPVKDINAPRREYRLSEPVREIYSPHGKPAHWYHTTWLIRCLEYLPEPFLAKQRPNYFWYACPMDMVTLDEVPEYCGLIEVEKHEYGIRPIIRRAAPRIHSNKVFTDKMKTDMLRSLSFKFVQ